MRAEKVDLGRIAEAQLTTTECTKGIKSHRELQKRAGKAAE
jgi:hypothetical protein